MSDAVIKATVDFYKQLYDKSVPMFVHDYDEDPRRIFRGSLTKTYAELGISTAYYSRVKRLLESQDCIEVVKRGHRTDPETVVILNHPPSPFAEEVLRKKPKEALTSGQPVAILLARIEKLERAEQARAEQEGGIDLVSALRNHESRLLKLEATESKVENGTEPTERPSNTEVQTSQ